MKDSLGDRMKEYERETRAVLPRGAWTVLRVDGRAFHSYTRGLARPYDEKLMSDMDKVAEALLREIDGAVVAYTQSDEVSVLVQDFSSENFMPWMGGVIAKWQSVGASLATATLFSRRMDEKMPLFDGRVFSLPSTTEACNYLIWRQRDTLRNAVSMAARAEFSHQQLLGKSVPEMKEMLLANGVDFDSYPLGFRQGRMSTRVVEMKEFSYVDKRTGDEVFTSGLRTSVVTEPAPFFSATEGVLLDLLPQMPTEILVG